MSKKTVQKSLLSIAAAVCLAVTFQLTRPSDLVWWTSFRLDHQGHHLRLLIPRGWERRNPVSLQHGLSDNSSTMVLTIAPTDQRPRLIRWLFPRSPENAQIVVRMRAGKYSDTKLDTGIGKHDYPHAQTAHRTKVLVDHDEAVEVIYERSNRAAFYATYRDICNSPVIE